MSKFIYLIGSLRNPEVPKLAQTLRKAGHIVFDDWYAAGPEADDKWMEYEKNRGHDFATALNGFAAQHVYSYDKSHLDRCGVGVLLMPAGKSGHLELGYMIGQGKPGYILLPSEPERFDVMYNFASGVFSKQEDLLDALYGPKLGPGTKVDVAGDPATRAGLVSEYWTHDGKRIGIDTAFRTDGSKDFIGDVAPAVRLDSPDLTRRYGGYNPRG